MNQKAKTPSWEQRMQPFVLAPKVKKAKYLFNLILRYDKKFQCFSERFVNLLLSIAVFHLFE